MLINLFVAPLAIAGLATFADGAIDRDLTVLALPLAAGARGLALTTMLGGLSAATGMVVVDSVALAITVSNDLVMPILLRRRAGQADAAAAGEIGARVLLVRRARDPRRSVLRLSLRAAGEQRGARLDRPAVVRRDRADRAGLPRRADLAARHRARRRRRAWSVGSLVWLYVLFLPSLNADGALADLLAGGPLGVAWLRPACADRRFPPIRWSAASRFRSAPTSPPSFSSP